MKHVPLLALMCGAILFGQPVFSGATNTDSTVALASQKTFTAEELAKGEELNRQGRAMFKFAPDQAIETLKIATDYGSARAAMLLGLVYKQGKFAPKDMGQYYRYLMMAADYGDADAQTILGMDYIVGTEDLAPDLLLGTHYLRLAAQQGQPQAQQALRTLNMTW